MCKVAISNSFSIFKWIRKVALLFLSWAKSHVLPIFFHYINYSKSTFITLLRRNHGFKMKEEERWIFEAHTYVFGHTCRLKLVFQMIEAEVTLCEDQ